MCIFGRFFKCVFFVREGGKERVDLVIPVLPDGPLPSINSISRVEAPPKLCQRRCAIKRVIHDMISLGTNILEDLALIPWGENRDQPRTCVNKLVDNKIVSRFVAYKCRIAWSVNRCNDLLKGHPRLVCGHVLEDSILCQMAQVLLAEHFFVDADVDVRDVRDVRIVRIVDGGGDALDNTSRSPR